MEISSFPFLSQEDYSLPLTSYSELLLLVPQGNENDTVSIADFENPTTSSTTTTTTSSRLFSQAQPTTKRVRADLPEVHTSDHQQPIQIRPSSTTMDSMPDFFGNLAYSSDEAEMISGSKPNNKRQRLSPSPSSAAAAGTTSGSRSPPPPPSGALGSSAGSASAAPGNKSQQQQQQQQRRLWVKDRSKDWWERCDRPDFPESEFKRDFRMSRSTFDFLCEELDSAVTKKDTMLRAAIPTRQRVAVCIWRLATGEPLRLVSKRFGLGISTCHKLVLEVCAAIKSLLMPRFLNWPDPARASDIKSRFESLSGIPNVAGAMYTTHVPIIAPKISVASYFNKRHTERNQKTSYSITIQGVVDHRGVFTDVCIGWPGSMSDERVLESSALYKRANEGLLKDLWVVGGKGYPLTDWVLVPYTHANLTWTQHALNEKVGVVQEVAKEAFGRLKGRWACLQKRTEVKLQDLPAVLGACCVLHNICEMRGETMEPEWKYDVFDDEMLPDQLDSTGAAQARDQIAHHLLHHGHAGTAFL